MKVNLNANVKCLRQQSAYTTVSPSIAVLRVNHIKEDHPDVLTGKMTHRLWLVTHLKKPEGSVEKATEK